MVAGQVGGGGAVRIGTGRGHRLQEDGRLGVLVRNRLQERCAKAAKPRARVQHGVEAL